jgi:hypothetical protein
MRSAVPGKMTVLQLGTSVLTFSSVTEKLCRTAVISCTVHCARGINRVVLSVRERALVFTVKDDDDNNNNNNNNKNLYLTVNTSYH